VRDGVETLWLLRRALASSRWPAPKLRGHQERCLRRLLAHAYANVPLYRALYDEAGFRPADFRDLDDLGTVPILTKERVKAARPEECVTRGVDPARCTTVRTSGSTGVPLAVHLGRHEARWQRAVAWRILFEHGFRWRDHTLEIRMSSGPSFAVQRMGIASKEWLSVLDPPESWARRLHAGGHDLVVAAAGTLDVLAEACLALGLDARPRLVVSDGETLEPATRMRVREALGCDPVDVYGLVELSNFAWECERHAGYHVSGDSHLVEVQAPTGDPGPLVATDLGMWTMPMLRYATGDIAEVDPSPCPCGRTLPKLGRIHGRAVDCVRLPDGRRLLWPFFHETLAGFPEIERWRVVQEDAWRIRLELAAPDSAGLRERVAAAVRAQLPDDLQLEVVSRDAIERVPGEKTRVVLSELDRARQESR
jgi:phenylacetate-CoA ligase